MVEKVIQSILINTLLCTMCSARTNTQQVEDAASINTDTIVDEYPIDRIELVKETINGYSSHKSCLNSEIREKIDEEKWWYITSKDNITMYMKGCPSEESELDSFDVILNYKENIEYKLCRTTEKILHVSFSPSKPLMVINYLDERPEHYDASLDDYFWIYNLDSLVNGVLYKDSIYCKYCDDGHVVGDNLFFTRSNERDDFQNGFWLTDIYVAPFNHIEDSVVIARRFRIRAVSSDGKYILAQNQNTISNWSCAIINVEQKKYQVLLGRNYCNRPVFYSDEEQKFGFAFGKKIVYVDMPKTFPFDALEKKNIFWPRPPKGWDKKFEKTPLK
ncbi:MAG: hypothetical protein K6G73_03180 [Marinilabiliaceae bacterium]|nr:hypothetical protein [Marinilabiliaceae bacterium]